MGNTVITIARSYGSGGRTLGKLLAKELGINYYDRELIRMASDESGINEALFGEVDEKLKKSPLFRIVKRTYRGEIIPPESGEFVSDDNLFNYQAKVIRQLAEAESCVIIGRCADYVLKEFDHVISLFFYAPREDCIRRVPLNILLLTVVGLLRKVYTGAAAWETMFLQIACFQKVLVQ